jgi:hypothetical protein
MPRWNRSQSIGEADDAEYRHFLSGFLVGDDTLMK